MVVLRTETSVWVWHRRHRGTQPNSGRQPQPFCVSCTSFSSSFYVGDAGNTSLVDAGTPLGATAVVTPEECWLSTLGVLHPGVPVMWYAYIRDLFPTAEAVRGAVCPM